MMRVGFHIIEKVKNANQCANAMRMRIAIKLFVRMRIPIRTTSPGMKSLL